MIIQGYDGSWVDQTSTLTTAGASASADTTETYIRGFRAYVADCGAYGGSNAGQIVIETIDGDAVCVIEAPDGTNALGSGQTEMAIYTVPDGKRAWVTRTFANVGGSKAATVNFYQRPNADTIAAPFSASRVWAVYGELVGPSESVYQALKGPFSARTDLWASAKGPTGGANIVVEFDVLLEDI